MLLLFLRRDGLLGGLALDVWVARLCESAMGELAGILACADARVFGIACKTAATISGMSFLVKDSGPRCRFEAVVDLSDDVDAVFLFFPLLAELAEEMVD